MWHPSRVHLHLIMINATQLSWRGELLRLPRCCKGSKGATLVVVAAAVVLPLVAGTTAEPKRHATCCCIIRSGKRHSNILTENAILICLWPTHTSTHAHPAPICGHLSVAAFAACGQPDKKAFYSKSSACIFLSLSHDCCACPAPPTPPFLQPTGRRMYLRR